jgi:drug/metabolite transporter superfamily protein YnfA
VPLGQASLYVYIVQSMLTFLLVNRAMTNPWPAAASTVAMVGLVWIMVNNRVLFRIIPR